MKVIRIVFLVLLALGMIVCNILFIFFQTYDPDKYLPKLSAKVSSYIGRPVSIGYVGPGLSLRGLTLDVGPVIIPDDPAFTTQPFVEVQRIRLVPDWWAFLLHRGVHFRLVQLESPRIHFIVSREGKFNAAAVGAENEPETKPSAGRAALSLRDITIPAQPETSQVSPKTVAWPTIEIKSIKIIGGAVSFIDQRPSSFMDVWLKGINAKLYGFSFSKPFVFYFSARFYSQDHNVHASAGVTLNKDRRLVTVSGMKITADLTRMDPSELGGISPLEGIRKGLSKFSGRLAFNLDDLQIIPSKSVKAQGDLDASGSVIKDFNPVRILMSGLPLPVGGLGGLEALLTGPVSEKLQAPDTVLDAARVSFSLHENTVFIDDMLLKTGIFELSAKGRVDHDLTTDVQTILHLSSDASGALTGKFPGFKSLDDGSGRVTMRAALTGVFPHLTYKPDKDFRKKSKKALWQEGGNILSAITGGR